jgi:hypothetical protein
MCQTAASFCCCVHACCQSPPDTRKHTLGNNLLQNKMEHVLCQPDIIINIQLQTTLATSHLIQATSTTTYLPEGI